MNAALAAAIVADLLLAASARRLRITRSGDTRVLLGETAAVTVTVRNPGRRPLRAAVRATWPPSAHAVPGRAALRVPGRRAGLSDQHAHPGPPRGQGVRPRSSSARSGRSGWPPGSAATP